MSADHPTCLVCARELKEAEGCLYVEPSRIEWDGERLVSAYDPKAKALASEWICWPCVEQLGLT